jgi:hypothetical protein
MLTTGPFTTEKFEERRCHILDVANWTSVVSVHFKLAPEIEWFGGA